MIFFVFYRKFDTHVRKVVITTFLSNRRTSKFSNTRKTPLTACIFSSTDRRSIFTPTLLTVAQQVLAHHMRIGSVFVMQRQVFRRGTQHSNRRQIYANCIRAWKCAAAAASLGRFVLETRKNRQ